MSRIVRADAYMGLVVLGLAAFGTATVTRGQAAPAAQAPAVASPPATAAQSLGQSFRGLHLRTHPNANAAGSQVYLVRADEIVMNDGARVENWPPLSANIGTTGAAGLDVGSRATATWYEIHAIRSSRDGTRNLLLHRAKDYLEDQSQAGTSAAETLAETGDRVALAQGFQAGVNGPVEFVDVSLRRNGSPAGTVWLTIESDVPGGAATAASDRLDAAKLPAAPTFIRFIFRTPPDLVASRSYRLVLHGAIAVDAANNVSWLGDRANVYSRGSSEQQTGQTWSPTGTVQDFAFRVYVTQHDAAVVLPPGYDESAKVGYVYNNSAGAFNGFIAMDREVMPLAWAGTGEFTSKTPLLVDLRTFVPPGTIRLELSAADTQAPNRVAAAPVPSGFDTGAANFHRGDGGQTGVIVTTPSDEQSAMMGRMITEYQSGYFFTTGGRARVYISAWAW